ncbi:MAG: hypothetical protein KJ600_04380 [Nanoarchaeota archaeon]|nr:hypothetical protein [Nanoarchaeota archaeon]MBU1103765.1 hypothetical protein [Nanoarchaeota archaeon]
MNTTIRLSQDSERRNYLVAKRSSQALKRYVDELATAIISGNTVGARYYNERIGEHLAIVENIDVSNVNHLREINGHLQNALEIQLIVVSHFIRSSGTAA